MVGVGDFELDSFGNVDEVFPMFCETLDVGDGDRLLVGEEDGGPCPSPSTSRCLCLSLFAFSLSSFLRCASASARRWAALTYFLDFRVCCTAQIPTMTKTAMTATTMTAIVEGGSPCDLRCSRWPARYIFKIFF